MSTEKTALLDGKNSFYSSQSEDEEFPEDKIISEQGTVSSFSTFILIVKGGVGAGILALPFGISESGIMGGAAALLLLTFLNIYASQLAIKCSKALVPESKKQTCSTWTAIGHQSCGIFGEMVVLLSLLSTLMGATAVYFILMGSTLGIFELGGEEILGYRIWILCILPVAVGLCLVDDLSIFSYCGVCGLFVILAGFGVTFVYGFENFELEILSEDLLIKPAIAQFLGIVAFSNAPVIVVPPFYDEMKNQKDIDKVMISSQTTISLIYFVLGFLGYALFIGVGINENIFLNLPNHSILSAIVQITLVIVVLFSLPVPVYMAASMADFSIIRSESNNFVVNFYKNHQFLGKRVVITLIVVIAAIISVSFPSFGDVMSILGCVTITILSYIVPPLCHLLMRWENISFSSKICHFLLIFCGCCVMVLGLLNAVRGGGGEVEGVPSPSPSPFSFGFLEELVGE